MIVIILSNWTFHDYWKQLSPEIRFTFCFDDISSLLDTIIVYQELIKIGKFDAFPVTLMVFRESGRQSTRGGAR